MKSKRTKNLIMLSVIIVGLFLTVFAKNIVTTTAQEEKDTLDEILERGYMIVGSDTTYPPFESINPETGLPEGFDVDIAHQIALDLGVDLVFKTSAWEPIIPNLKAKQFDMIISAMTITAEREKEVDFSRWYYKSEQAVLVPANNPLNINSVDDLNKSGIRIGVQSGTTSHIYANESLQAATLSTYDDILTAIEDLKQGKLDAVLGDYAVLAKAAKDGKTKIVDTYSPEDFGIAVREGETRLLDRINKVINKLLGSDPNNPQPSDLYNAIYYKWFEVNAPGYTGTVTSTVIPTAKLYTDIPKSGGIPGFEFSIILVTFIAPGLIILKRRFKKA